ncbi:hypothetical protein [Microbacterium suwonense]|uniref:Uncharacterized protein n=1 Tax=Microbacterium suwonense TaxID=683047 RepID=A0ABM8FU09_9MICO|nr:hypothetical protein [Microbacterium suwonense]BDZ39170.1 hypothetical protein GCM10025863_17840 [Microbacterium suwonense]
MIVVIWNLVGPAVHSAVLQVGWCAVAIVAAGKTMVMIFKLLRRDLGYTV